MVALSVAMVVLLINYAILLVATRYVIIGIAIAGLASAVLNAPTPLTALLALIALGVRAAITLLLAALAGVLAIPPAHMTLMLPALTVAAQTVVVQTWLGALEEKSMGPCAAEMTLTNG